MAKRRSLKSRAASRRPRNHAGQFLSREQASHRSAEEIERAKDRQHEQSKYTKAQQKRGREVALAHYQREQRSHTKQGKLKQTYRKQKSNTPQLSKPSKQTQYGKFRVRLYKFRNVRGLQLAGDFVKSASKRLPKAVGRIAIGTGYGKGSEWVGSKTESLSNLWWYSQRAQTTASAQNVLGGDEHDKRSIWTEVEIIDIGKVTRHGATNGHRRSYSKRATKKRR